METHKWVDAQPASRCTGVTFLEIGVSIIITNLIFMMFSVFSRAYDLTDLPPALLSTFRKITEI